MQHILRTNPKADKLLTQVAHRPGSNQSQNNLNKHRNAKRCNRPKEKRLPPLSQERQLFHTHPCVPLNSCHVQTTFSPSTPAFLLLDIVWGDIVCCSTLSEEKVNSVPEQRPFDIPVSYCQVIFACLTTVQEELYQHCVSLMMFRSPWIWGERERDRERIIDKRKSFHVLKTPFICMLTGTMWALSKFCYRFKIKVFFPNNSCELKTGSFTVY